MSDCNHTFRTEEHPARIDCCIHCGALEPVVTIATLQARIAELEKALTIVSRWELPATGEFWESGEECSYGSLYGSNGERDYMIKVARAALLETEK